MGYLEIIALLVGAWLVTSHGFLVNESQVAGKWIYVTIIWSLTS